MKKGFRCTVILSFVIAMLACFSLQGWCASETHEYVDADGNVYMYFYRTENGGEININGIELKNPNTELVIPDTIDGYPVTKLVTYTYSRYNFGENLVNVTIPDTVKYIGSYVFDDCSKIKSVKIGNAKDLVISEKAFYSCDALETVTFGNTKNVTIEAGAFSLSKNLKTVDFGNPTGMIIKNECFKGSGMTEITVPKGVSLGQYVFSECPNLQKAEIHASPLKQVEKTTDSCTGKVVSEKDVFSEYLFYKCPVLREVTVSSYETIYENMFSDCPALESGNVGNATAIGKSAFANCTALKEFKSNGKIEIGNSSFLNCSALEYFDFSKAGKLSAYSFKNCTSLKKIDSLGTDTIPYDCFYGCTSLTSLDLSGVNVIKENAFENCTGLKELHINHDINVWSYAFKNCTGLEKIIVEDNVKYVDIIEKDGTSSMEAYNIFEGCTNVKSIYIGASFVPKVVRKNSVYLAFDFFNFVELSGLETTEVSPDNPYYRSDDGVLYVDEGDVYILLCYPRAKKGTYYSTEKALADVDKDFTLGWAAFGFNQNLKEVHFTKPVIYPEFEDRREEHYCLLYASFCDSSVEKVTFPKGGMKTIGMDMFEGSAIREIDLSGTVRIMSNAFYRCENLTEANLLSCTELDGYAFCECTSLKYVNLPLWTGEEATAIWGIGSEFCGCTALESVNMPLVESIHESCFEGCTSLVYINAPKCEEVDSRAFFNCVSLETVDMPLLGAIYNEAFSGCTNLKSIRFNEEAKYMYIGAEAFKNCTSLKNIRLNNVYCIDKNAFLNCASLKNINLYGAKEIDDSAFENCTSLTLAQFSNTKCKFGNNAFKNCPNLSFYCDEESDAYTYAAANNIPVIAVSVSFQSNKYEYTGKEIEPSVIVSISGMTLTRNKDYTLTFENNKEVGTASVTVHFIGDFEGLPDAYRQFYIVRRNIDSATVEYVKDNVYDGEEIKPAVVVSLDGKTLTEGVDYEIVYQSGTDTGTMLFTVKGKGNYTGKIDCYYNIVRRDIAEAQAQAIPDSVYTGSEICPVPVLNWNGFTLVCGEDYEVRYFENVNSGLATAVIYGKGNFCGTLRVRFKIFGKDISKAEVSAVPDMEYTGEELKPAVTVTLDGKKLTEGTDYTVSYIDNTESGDAAVIINGTGNYSGTLRKTFRIYKNSVYSFTVFSETQMTETYDGTPLKPEMEVYFGTDLLTEGVDYTLRLENNVSAGTGVVTVCGIGRFEGERSFTFTILPCEINENDITVGGSMEYNGEPVEPTITVTKNGQILENGKDYAVSYKNNDKIGTAYVTVEGLGNYLGTVELEYEVYSAPEEEKPPVSNPDDENKPTEDENKPSDNENKPSDESNNTQKPSDKDDNGAIKPNGISEDKREENGNSKSPAIPNMDSESNETALRYIAVIPVFIALCIADDKIRRKFGRRTAEG